MKATTWRQRCTAPRRADRRKTPLRVAALLSVLLALAGCSAVPTEDAAEEAVPSNYGILVATALKSFKDYRSYSNFEISELRWIHAQIGWSWLACVRYDDRGLRRVYSFFIRNNAVVSSRYEAAVDQCGLQKYAPFDVNSGSIGPPTLGPQHPIY